VLKEEPSGKKNDQTEQRTLAATQEKREFMSFGRRGRQLRRTTRIS